MQIKIIFNILLHITLNFAIFYIFYYLMESYIIEKELLFLKGLFPAKIRGVFCFDRTDISILIKAGEQCGYLSFKLDNNCPAFFFHKGQKKRSLENANINRLHKLLSGHVIMNIEYIPFERYFFIKLQKENTQELFVSMIPQKLNIILLDKEGTIRWSNTYRAIDKDNTPILEGAFFNRSQYLQKKTFKTGNETKTDHVLSRSLRSFMSRNNAQNIQGLFYEHKECMRFDLFLDDFNLEKDTKYYILPKGIVDSNKVFTGTVNDCLVKAYSLYRKYNDAKKTLRQSLKSLQKELKKQEKKKAIMLSEYESALEFPKWRLYGELLKANINLINNRSEIINLVDFNGKEHTIQLDKKLSIVENMNKFFNHSKRMKRGLSRIRESIQINEKQIESLRAGIKEIMDMKTYKDIAATQNEALSRKTSKSKPKAAKYSNIREYATKEGHIILVASNSKANDELTFHIAKPDDIWLHAQNIPGSHIIIKNTDRSKSVPLEVLLQAARLAVKNSRAKNSSKVSVDYTKKKFVKKPKRSALGFVIYTNQKTLIIDNE